MRAQLAGQNVDVPAAGQHLWQWFSELDRARSGNGYGANPISFSEIDAWARLRTLEVAEWELEALRAMDDVRLGALNDKASHPVEPLRSERPMTPQLFSALFAKASG